MQILKILVRPSVLSLLMEKSSSLLSIFVIKFARLLWNDTIVFSMEFLLVRERIGDKDCGKISKTPFEFINMK